MPVTEPLSDEQLALIAQRIERKADNITDRRRLVAEVEWLRAALAAQPHESCPRCAWWEATLNEKQAEVERLWAALAARPQPLFEGPAFEFCQSSTHPTTRVVVYPAPAGSATPTDDQLADGYPLAVAGSATPTVDSHGFTDAEHDTLVTLIDRNPKRVQQMLTLRSAAQAGSATPTGDNDE